MQPCKQATKRVPIAPRTTAAQRANRPRPRARRGRVPLAAARRRLRRSSDGVDAAELGAGGRILVGHLAALLLLALALGAVAPLAPAVVGPLGLDLHGLVGLLEGAPPLAVEAAHAAERVEHMLGIKAVVFDEPAEEICVGFTRDDAGELLQDITKCRSYTSQEVDYSSDGMPALWIDACHPTPAGAEQHFRLLVEALKKKELW